MGYRSRNQHAVTPQHRGRYPGFDVLDSVKAWDDVTTGVVLGRLALPAEFAFFTPDEVAIAGPLLDLLLNQDSDPRVPVLALIDARLAAGETDGWHYDDMPQDAQAWRDTLRFLQEDAQQHHHGRGFAHLIGDEQAALIQAVQYLNTESKTWHDWPAMHVWSMWTRYACTAFYSHPWAWNEIGFPGPAYPRGYLNPGINSREHWEIPDSGTADSGTADSGTDPVTFSARVEQARRDHQRVLGQEGSA